MKRKKGFPISIQLFVGVFSLSLLIVVIIGIVTMGFFRDEMENGEIKYHLEITNNTKEQFTVQMTMIDECIYELIKLPALQEAIHKIDEKEISQETKDEIENYMDVMASINYSINNVHILGTNGFCISTNHIFSDIKWLEYFQNYLGRYQNEPGRKGIWTDFHSSEEDNYLSSTSYIKPIFDSETKEVFGIAVLDISYESLHKLFTSSSIRIDDRAVIVNQDGNILFQYPLQADYTEVLKKYPEVVEKGTQIEGKLYKTDVIIVSEKIPIADWSIIRFVNKDMATQLFHDMMSAMIVVLVIVVSISLCYAMMMMHMITRPIRKLMQVCHKVEQGDFDAHVDLPRKDEFGELGDTFNHMLRQINLLFAQEKINQERKAELEYQILEAQINPHFLYNTLDSIKWLSVMQGVDNIGEMCTALINLLKYNLGKKEGNTILQDELDSVNNYIVIQKYRYSDIFEFTTSIDEEAANCRVLRFILQPLVENSIVHGFAGERVNYRIHISARIYDDRLHIKVIDNGAGMDHERTKQLNSDEKKGTRFSNIGVKNIRERLRLYFGEEAQLVFDSEPNIATIAEIILPVILETKD
ncbi:MAG: histidine kinase [Lachnospiraceae bacterium]|nr:histidine kinase [Fusicatenibacter sp.]MCI6868188.1 histidine kinase [Lachnospiraceae bacterium]